MAWGGPAKKKEECAAGNPDAKDWYDKALKVVEEIMMEYWNDSHKDIHATTKKPTNKEDSQALQVESEFNRHCCMLVNNAGHQQEGWASELCRYLGDLLHNVSKDTDMIQWWSKHSSTFPTLACMARDICAIPASSVPCERLFSASAEIATDQQSHLDAEKFEELQVLKSAWQDSVMDFAAANSAHIDEVRLEEFQELLVYD
ncbi:hypothetical protein PAXRUDRAFT_90310, partial [Paxillus rubicundulus Ve08.2h10]